MQKVNGATVGSQRSSTSLMEIRLPFAALAMVSSWEVHYLF